MITRKSYMLLSVLAGMLLPAALALGYSFESVDYFSYVGPYPPDDYTVTQTRVHEEVVAEGDEDDIARYEQSQAANDSSYDYGDTADQSADQGQDNYVTQPPVSDAPQSYAAPAEPGSSYVPAAPATVYSYSPTVVAPVYPDYYPYFAPAVGFNFWYGHGPHYYPHYRPYWHRPYPRRYPYGPHPYPGPRPHPGPPHVGPHGGPGYRPGPGRDFDHGGRGGAPDRRPSVSNGPGQGRGSGYSVPRSSGPRQQAPGGGRSFGGGPRGGGGGGGRHR